MKSLPLSFNRLLLISFISQFYPYNWENWLISCVCVCTSVGIITVSCMFKNVFERNVLRIIRLVHSKESKQDFSNVFVKQNNCMWVLIYCESSMMYDVS